MLHELPVIATPWSGNTQFMNPGNSFPVKYTLQENPRDLHKVFLPANIGFCYAEPDIDDVAAQMRYVFAHYSDAQKKGKSARQEILNHHSFAAVARQVKEALEKLQPSPTRYNRLLKPHDLFLNMYPLYFPGKPGNPEQWDKEFAQLPASRYTEPVKGGGWPIAGSNGSSILRRSFSLTGKKRPAGS
jgi:hypothetical protein